MGEAGGQEAGGGTSLSAFGPKNGAGKRLEVMKSWVWNSTPNQQERITASSGGMQPRMVVGKGPNTVLVRRESPDTAASGEHTVGASWEFPGLSFRLLDEVTVSAWLWAWLGWGLRPGWLTEV